MRGGKKSNRKKLQEAAREALKQIREFLNTWDPYSLIAMGAPQDEYDSEARDIYRALAAGDIVSHQQLAIHIAAVFEKWFEDPFKAEECSDVAHGIWDWWHQRQEKTDSE